MGYHPTFLIHIPNHSKLNSWSLYKLLMLTMFKSSKILSCSFHKWDINCYHSSPYCTREHSDTVSSLPLDAYLVLGLKGSYGSYFETKTPYCSHWITGWMSVLIDLVTTIYTDFLFPTSSSVLVIFHPLITVILTTTRWYFIVILICISLMINGAE